MRASTTAPTIVDSATTALCRFRRGMQRVSASSIVRTACVIPPRDSGRRATSGPSVVSTQPSAAAAT